MKLNELKTKISDFYHKDNKHKAIAIVVALVPVLLVGGVSVAVALNNPPAPAKTTITTSTNATNDEKQEEASETQQETSTDTSEQTEGASTDTSNPSSSDTTSSSSSASTAPSATTTSSSSSNTSSPNAVTATSPLPPAPAGKKGHWEKKLVKAAYDEPVYEKVQKTRVLAEGYTRKEPKGRSYVLFRVDGYKAYTDSDADAHANYLIAAGKSTQTSVAYDMIDVYYPPVTETYYEWVQTGTKHHEAVYENIWIDD